MRGRVCPLCRGDFGGDRAPNVVLGSLIRHYFPVEDERGRRRAREMEEAREGDRRGGGGEEGAVVLRAAARNDARNDDAGWRRRVLAWMRPLLPWLRVAPALVYPIVLLVLFWAVFGGRKKMRLRQRLR